MCALPDSIKDIDIEIIRNMCEFDMNVSSVSKAMYMHRNTIDYHIDKIKESTGLDARVFYDLVELLEMVQEKDQLNYNMMQNLSAEDAAEELKKVILRWLLIKKDDDPFGRSE